VASYEKENEEPWLYKQKQTKRRAGNHIGGVFVVLQGLQKEFEVSKKSILK